MVSEGQFSSAPWISVQPVAGSMHCLYCHNHFFLPPCHRTWNWLESCVSQPRLCHAIMLRAIRGRGNIMCAHRIHVGWGGGLFHLFFPLLWSKWLQQHHPSWLWHHSSWPWHHILMTMDYDITPHDYDIISLWLWHHFFITMTSSPHDYEDRQGSEAGEFL